MFDALRQYADARMNFLERPPNGRNSQPPPYSIFLADQLWEATYALRLGRMIQSQLTLIELRFDRTREALQRLEELRQVSNGPKLRDAARPPSIRGRETWRSFEIGRHQCNWPPRSFRKKREEAELAETQARLAFAERQFQTAAQQTVFTEDDLKKIHIRLSEEREDLEAELHQTAADRRVDQQTLEKMEQQLEARSIKQTPRTSIDRAGQNMERVKADLELKRAEVDTRTAEEDLLRQLLDFVGGERQLWDARFAVAHSAEPGQAREAYARFSPLFNNVAASRDYVRQQVLVVSGQAGEVAHRLRTAAGAEERGRLESLVNNFRQREQAYDRALRRLDHTTRFVERWKAEVKYQHKELPLSDRLVDWSRQAGGGTKTVWNFEVFSAEDTIELDGKQIIGRRSITVGKIISALGILLIGYWICLRLAS